MHHTGLRQEDAAVSRDVRPPSKPPMSDAEFHTFLDAVGRLVYPQHFRLAVYQAGVEPSLRKVVWRHLLNIYPESLNGRERFDYLRRKSKEYLRLRDEWQGRQGDDAVRVVAAMVRKDVLRTDRTHPFYVGDDNTNGTALFNVLVTFAVTHPRLSYWQGMSDIASPILAVEGDEPAAYICFCALMRRLAASFAADGAVMTLRFRHLVGLLRHFDRALYAHIGRCGARDMFFTYRWLLLEMKREFPLDDAMYALEVMWSSLPISPPDGDLSLFDPAFREATISSSAPASHAEAYVHLRSYQRRISCGHSVTSDSAADFAASVNGAPSHEKEQSRVKVPHERSVGDASATRQLQSGDVVETSVSSNTMAHVVERSAASASAIDQMRDNHAATSVSLENHAVSVNGTLSNSTREKWQSSSMGRGGNWTRHIAEESASDTPATKRPQSEQSPSLERVQFQQGTSGGRVIPRVVEESATTNAKAPHSKQSESPEEARHSDSDAEDADEETGLLPTGDGPSIGFAKSAPDDDDDQLPPLPPPSDLGCGNPFLMFLCLSTLILQRDRVMSSCHDYNDIAMHFDKMVRRHRVDEVVHYARQLYATYLRELQQRSDSDEADQDLSSAPNRI